MLNTESNKEKVWCLLQYLTVVLELLLNPIPVIHTGSAVSDDIPVFITRHSLVKAKGDVLVLLYGFLFVFFVNDFSTTRRANSHQILHAGVLWFRMCLLPVWGLAARGGTKKGKMKFSWKTYVECEWRVCVSSTDALFRSILILFYMIKLSFHFDTTSSNSFVTKFNVPLWLDLQPADIKRLATSWHQKSMEA